MVKKYLGIAIALVATLGLAGWWMTGPYRARAAVARLVDSTDENVDAHLEAVLAFGDAALPALLDALAAERGVDHLESALSSLGKTWGVHHAKTQSLLKQLHERFDRMPRLSKAATLNIWRDWLRLETDQPAPVSLCTVASEIVQRADQLPELRQQTLSLTAAFLERVAPDPWLPLARTLAERGLQESDPNVRVASLQVVVKPMFRKEAELWTKVVQLLGDPVPAVRKAALIALSPRNDIVSEDDLLPLLHDEDAEVRKMCETSLQSRGLSGQHLEMARLISDTRPQARLRVLEHLGETEDLDTGVWLRRLTQDTSPAVRAAAARAINHLRQTSLSDRLQEMSRTDPNAEVRSNAEFYLQKLQRVNP